MTVQKLFGWNGPNYDFYRAWEDTDGAQEFAALKGVGYRDSAGARVALWDAVIKVTGKHLPNIPQEVGDCVSWGMKHAADHLACYEIARLGDNEEFHASFAPYFYGISRVQVGGGQLGREDGSLGIWAAEGVKRYGVLRGDYQGVPPYSGAIAKEWGASGPPQTFVSEGRQHLIRDFARLHSYAELRDALANGYPVTIASMRGFNMQLKFDPTTDKHWFQGHDRWPHQMSILGVDDDSKRPGVFRLNSWGPHTHGEQADGPPGGGWQDAEDIDHELSDPNTECIAYSQFDGFPAQMPNYYFA